MSQFLLSIVCLSFQPPLVTLPCLFPAASLGEPGSIHHPTDRLLCLVLVLLTKKDGAYSLMFVSGHSSGTCHVVHTGPQIHIRVLELVPPCPAHAQLVIPLSEAVLSFHRFGSLHQMAHCILYLRKLITQPEFWGHQGTAVTKVVNTVLSCENMAYWSRLTDSFCMWSGIAEGPSSYSGVQCWGRLAGFLCRVREERDLLHLAIVFQH